MSIISGGTSWSGPQTSSGSGGSWSGPIAGAISAAGGYLAAKEASKSQREANEQNERLMREAWARDDTATQRRVKDLKASGINPLLASGMSPGQSQPIQVQSTGKESGGHIAGAVQNAISAYTAQFQRKMAQADIEYRNIQSKQLEVMTKILDKYGPEKEETAIGLGKAQTESERARQGLMGAQKLYTDALAKLPEKQASLIDQQIEESKKRIEDLSSQATHRGFQNANLTAQTVRTVSDGIVRIVEVAEEKRMNQFRQNQITAAVNEIDSRTKLNAQRLEDLMRTATVAIVDNRTVHPTYARPGEKKRQLKEQLDNMLGQNVPGIEQISDHFIKAILGE